MPQHPAGHRMVPAPEHDPAPMCLAPRFRHCAPTAAQGVVRGSLRLCHALLQTQRVGRAGQPSSLGSSACLGAPLLPAQLPHLSRRIRTFLDSLTFNYYLPFACVCWLHATYISIKIQFMPIITNSGTSALTRSLPLPHKTSKPAAELE